MSEEIGILYKKLASEVSKMHDDIRSKQILMDALRKECEHKWEYSHTCHHKGEDYYECIWCGATH